LQGFGRGGEGVGGGGKLVGRGRYRRETESMEALVLVLWVGVRRNARRAIAGPLRGAVGRIGIVGPLREEAR